MFQSADNKLSRYTAFIINGNRNSLDFSCLLCLKIFLLYSYMSTAISMPGVGRGPSVSEHSTSEYQYGILKRVCPVIMETY
jgi:hypothetical protein